MGILTNAINQLVQGTIGLGIGQLDNYFTGLVESGQQERAAQEAFKLDQELAQRGLMQDSLLAGQFNVPGMDLAGGAAIDPNSAQGRGVLSSLATLPPIDPVVNKSPVHSQLVFQRGNQFIQNNPLVQQREQAQKEQEAITKARSQAFGGLARQRDIGTADIGPGILGQRDFTSEQLQQAQARGRGLSVTEQEKAKEPGRKARFAERLQLKQTPGARAMGSGGGGEAKDGGGGPVSSVTTAEIGRMEKTYLRNSEYQDIGIDGKPMLNERGQNALNKAADILAGQKKKNPLRAIKEGRDAEMKEFQAQQEKTSTPEGRLDVLRGRATTPEAQQRLQEVEQQLEEGQQAAPAPTATQQTPQERATQATQGPDAATAQKINTLKSRGVSPEKIKQALEAEGLNPADYGY